MPWTNKDRLLRRMKNIAPAVRAAIKAQTKANAEEVVAQVKRNMQTFDEPTGKLEASLEITDVSDDTKISYQIREGGGLEYYAPSVEFGHEDVPPKPHFWPAYRMNKRKFKARTSRAAKKAIQGK